MILQYLLMLCQILTGGLTPVSPMMTRGPDDEFTARDLPASLWYVFLSTYAFSDVCVYQQNMYIIQ